jgi:hypothetical protein
MKLNSVLTRLNEFKVRVLKNEVDAEGWRTIIVGCAAPSPPFAIGRYLYTTWVMGPGEEDVSREVRDAIRRRLWHGTTDIFGDDAEDAPALAAIDISDMLANAPDPPPDEDLS